MKNAISSVKQKTVCIIPRTVNAQPIPSRSEARMPVPAVIPAVIPSQCVKTLQAHSEEA